MREKTPIKERHAGLLLGTVFDRFYDLIAPSPHDSGSTWERIFRPFPIQDYRIVPEQSLRTVCDAVHQSYWQADQFAVYYARLHRSAMLTNFVLAALSVTIALLSLPLSAANRHGWATACFVGELATLLLVKVNVYVAKRRRWREKFVDYRILSEQLRTMEFLAPLGQAPQIRGLARHRDPYRQRWTAWIIRNLTRQIGPPNADLNDTAYRGSVRKLLREWISAQLAYHESVADRAETSERRLEIMSEWMVALMIVACLLHILGGISPTFHEHLEHAEVWLIVVAGTLPAWEAALHGIGQQAELGQRRRRSTEMARDLGAMVARLKNGTPEPQSSAYLTWVALDAADSMLSEALDWHRRDHLRRFAPG